MTSPLLELDSVHKRYGDSIAVRDVSFTLERGEFLVILGPSGSGKSTLLSMIGGHVTPDAGDIRLEGRSIVGLPPDRIDTVTIFQDYALFPHLRVWENLSFGLRMKGVGKNEIDRRVESMMRLFRLEGLERRRVSEISGGEKQRVATARALAVDPAVILMDEPLGALDRAIKVRLQSELRDVLDSIGATTVYVTHDQAEGLSMADRVAVMNDGVIEQLGTPSDVYVNPTTEFVATFVGGANILQGRVEGEREDGVDVMFTGRLLSCRGRARAGDDVKVAVRPEDIGLEEPPQWVDGVEARDREWRAPGRVEHAQYFGAHSMYDISLEGGDPLQRRIQVSEAGRPGFAVGDSVVLHLEPRVGVVVRGDPVAAVGTGEEAKEELRRQLITSTSGTADGRTDGNERRRGNG